MNINIISYTADHNTHLRVNTLMNINIISYITAHNTHLRSCEECSVSGPSADAVLPRGGTSAGSVPGSAGGSGSAAGGSGCVGALLLRPLVCSLHHSTATRPAGGAASGRPGAVPGCELLVASGPLQEAEELLPVSRHSSVLQEVRADRVQGSGSLRLSGELHPQGLCSACVPAHGWSPALLSHTAPDHQGAVRFAVVTNQAVAEGVSLREDESVYLHRRLNSSLVFPRAQRNFTAQAVSDWVLENKESVVYWIQPTRAKSYSLEAELQKGPALLTFLPHNPLTANQLLDQVSAVALLYQSGCGSSAPRLCCQCVPVCASSGVCEVCVQRSVCSGLHQSLQRLQSSASCWSVQSSYTPSGRLSVCCGASVCRGGASVCSGASISGLQCRSNRTLRFYMLDAELHRPLAHRLGARGGLHRPFITIINLRDETHHVLEPSGTLEGFIQNFSVPYSPLRRHLVGQEAPQQTQSLVQEVTSDSFLQTVMDSQRDVLLLYYSAWCGFCSVLNHVFLQLGRLFRGNRALTVARVNVGRNDLPWEFMVDHLPTVLFFPRHRKQMSVKFPENTPMTVPNLLRFVLQHTGHAPWEEQQSGEGEEPVRGEESVSLLGAELRALQQEVFSLHRVRERVSQQLDVLWRENRRLTLHTHTLQSQNQELQAQIHQLEALYREKTHQLTHTVHRLQELADASEELLKENTLLKVLLTALSDADHRQTTEDRQTTDHRQATEEHDENTHAEDESS
ncbi:thioredoxin domain-containing protein 11 isoform X1 [Danio rerio]|uniref:Thioredoxin domain-containing protein 11 isoform X1 n=1 Tax=Danio rerio TaxID=7955 RepID=A0AC58JFM6_DANRE